MLKNKSISGLKVLLSPFLLSTLLTFLLWGCASDDDDEENIWAATSNIYSTASITSSKATVSANGDVVFIWQEQETEVRDDLAKDTEHTFADTIPLESHANIHKHKLLYSRTSVKAKYYDAAAGSWGSNRELSVGYWEKIKSGVIDVADVGDDTKIIYEENINNIFIGHSTVAINTKGDAIFAWIQLAENTVTTGDAGAGHTLFVSQFNAATNSWSARTAISNGSVVMQNKVALNLNDSNVAQLVWLGRDGSSNIVNAYKNTYDGSAWSAVELISDGTSTVRDIKLVQRNQTSGVAVWLQDNELSQSAAQTQVNLYSNWYNATAWNATASLVSNGVGEVLDFSVAKNSGGKIWASWSQTNSGYASGLGLPSSDYDVDEISTIWVNDFSGDIDADLTSGSWAGTGAVNIQSNTEIVLATHDSSIAVDANGNVVVAWVEKGDATIDPDQRKDAIVRANAYSTVSGNWLSESFVVSNTAKFSTSQPIEKTIPNDHVSPKVVSAGQNQFTISWQYWSVSPTQSGYKLFSLDYDVSNKTSSAVSVVSESVGSVVNQIGMFAVGDDVQMLWLQETGSGVHLKKSVK